MNFKDFKRKKNAGESLVDKNMDLFLDKYILWVLIFVTLWTVVIIEGVHLFLGDKNLFAFSFLITVIFMIKIYFLDYKKWIKNVENNNKGRKGEEFVGEYIKENFKNENSKIIDDLTLTGGNGKKYNIDHILINEKGVFVFETKNQNTNSFYSKMNYSKWVNQTQRNIASLKKEINEKDIFGLVIRPGQKTHKNLNFSIPVLNERYIKDYLDTKENIFDIKKVEEIYGKILSLEK